MSSVLHLSMKRRYMSCLDQEFFYSRFYYQCRIGDPKSCKAYANNALAQQRLNQSKGCGFGGVHWHLNHNRHYNWCMKTTPTLRYQQTKIRQDLLTRCGQTGGKAKVCKNYANNAIAQQRVNINRRCGYSGGGRWHTNYNNHYNWCMKTKSASHASEMKFRKDALARCARPTQKVTYLGCFIDKPQRDLRTGVSTGTKPMTNQACISTCRAKGFRFAGTQYSTQCFCDNSYGRYGKAPANECNKPCQGNANAKCGGTWRNSVYKTGK
ncbi:WSC domain-containing protein [Nymphon striatum]|nr:WSC domain-containing protein [Nymphon striatum]